MNIDTWRRVLAANAQIMAAAEELESVLEYGEISPAELESIGAAHAAAVTATSKLAAITMNRPADYQGRS